MFKGGAERGPSVRMFIDKMKLCLKKGWGNKITLKYDTNFPLFECRDTDDCIDCNLFAEAKLDLDSLRGIWVEISSVVHYKVGYIPISIFRIFVIVNCTV